MPSQPLPSSPPSQAQPQPNSHTRQIMGASVTMMLGLALTMVVGIYRSRLLAITFGTSTDLDAFNAANALPELLYTILAGGAFSLAYIPIYTQVFGQNRARANQLFTQVFSILLGVVLLASLLLAALAPILVTSAWGVGPGFSPAQQELTIQLFRMLLLGTILFCVSSLVSATLQAHQHFILPAIIPMLYSLGQIIGILVLPAELGIFRLGYGAILGAFFHLTAQLPMLIRKGIRLQIPTDWRNPEMQRIAILMLPRIGDLFLARFSISWLNSNVASNLAPGSVSALQYAFQLMNMPWTLIGTAIGIASFPTLAALAAQATPEAQRQAFTKLLRIVIALAVPAAAGLALLGQPIIRILYEGGDFTAESTRMVYLALQCYSLAILSQSMLDIIVRGYAARQNTLIPLLVSIGTTTLNVILAVTLTKTSLQHGGLALANGIAVAVEVTIDIFLLAWLWKMVDLRALGSQLLKVSIATAALGVGITGLGMVWQGSELLQLVGGIGIGAALYLIVGILLRITELREVLQAIGGQIQKLMPRSA